MATILIGIGEDGLDGLSAKALEHLNNADLIIGAKRHLDLIAKIDVEKQQLSMPFRKGLDETLVLHQKFMLASKKLVLLASGDPMHFGFGSSLLKHINMDELEIIPHSSSFSLAANRLGWALQEVKMISLHGRAVEQLNLHLCEGQKLICLTSNGGTIDDVADLLVDAGFGRSKLHILEHMGGDAERILSSTANGWEMGAAKDLNTLAIELIKEDLTANIPNIAGLADDLFIHDGQLTKSDIRALTLNKLLPSPNSVMWDLGAGSGSVGIEYMRLGQNSMVHAVEKNATRIQNIEANALNLGVPALKIYEGASADLIDKLPDPDAIFIGGGLSFDLFNTCFDRLKVGGRLVINSVTIESIAVHAQIYEHFKDNFKQLSYIKAAQYNHAHAVQVGQLHGYQAKMPIAQIAITKVETE